MVSLSACNDGDSPHVIGLLTPSQLLTFRPVRTLQGVRVPYMRDSMFQLQCKWDRRFSGMFCTIGPSYRRFGTIYWFQSFSGKRLPGP
jgi:hypothetical protein